MFKIGNFTGKWNDITEYVAKNKEIPGREVALNYEDILFEYGFTNGTRFHLLRATNGLGEPKAANQYRVALRNATGTFGNGRVLRRANPALYEIASDIALEANISTNSTLTTYLGLLRVKEVQGLFAHKEIGNDLAHRLENELRLIHDRPRRRIPHT